MVATERGGIAGGDTHLAAGVHNAGTAEADVGATETASGHLHVGNIGGIERTVGNVVETVFRFQKQCLGQEVLRATEQGFLVVDIDGAFFGHDGIGKLHRLTGIDAGENVRTDEAT